jgi:hypothetical protein
MEVTCLKKHFEELIKNPKAGEKWRMFKVRITSIDPLSVSADVKCLDGCDANGEIVGDDAEKVKVGREYTVSGTTLAYDSTVFIYSGG